MRYASGMGLMRSVLLSVAQSRWMRERAARHRFVRRTVSRFMPGEELSDALAAAEKLRDERLGTVFTHLGENISDPAEAGQVTEHYLQVLDRIKQMELPTEVSVKPTQLGLDLDAELCYRNFEHIVRRAAAGQSMVWIDMESSPYVDATLQLFRRARQNYPNVGVCLQAYLYRTSKDLAELLPLGGGIRLVKGAYLEPADIAFPKKKDVDENYFELARQLLSPEARRAGIRTAIATHDRELIRRICDHAVSAGLGKREGCEFQMLFGIQSQEQRRLAQEGYRSIVLISYGTYWFPWFMRRLAERPANALFLLRNMFG